MINIENLLDGIVAALRFAWRGGEVQMKTFLFVIGSLAFSAVLQSQTFPPNGGNGGSGATLGANTFTGAQTIGPTVIDPTLGLKTGSTLAVNIIALAKAGAFTITNLGTPGGTTYGYQVSGCSTSGCGVASNQITTVTGNAVLNSTNFNRLALPSVVDAYTCAVWRTTGGVYGYLGTGNCGGAFNDTGITPIGAGDWQSAYPPTQDLSRGTYAPFARFGNYPYAGYSSNSAIDVAQLVTDPPTQDAWATTIQLMFDPISDYTQSASSQYLWAFKGGTKNVTRISANSSIVVVNGTGITANALGAQIEAWNETGNVGTLSAVESNIILDGGTATDVSGITTQFQSNGGTATNVYGVHSLSPSGASSATNLYGMKIEDQTGATSNWAIKTGAGRVQFGDTLIVAQHTPASSTETCTAGQIADDANYHYACVATNTWKRVALSTW